MSVAGTANVLVISQTGANITGYANVTGNITAGNATLGNSVTANYFVGNLYFRKRRYNCDGELWNITSFKIDGLMLQRVNNTQQL